jgi:uncharacterized membrane protein YhhN
MLASPWLWLTVGLMAVDWVDTGFKLKKIRLLSKPGALVMLIIWFSIMGGWHGKLIWFGLGLVFSLLGDIFLLRADRAFLFGLSAFLVGHLCYIIGFNTSAFHWHPAFLVMVAGVGLVAFLIGRHILRGLKRGATYSRMKKPILAYMTVIGLMVLSALACFFRPAWSLPAALLSTVGAASFLASDSILASDRFVRQRWWAAVTLMITYHLGQIFIIAGALLALG